jgi:hypothetical protein
MPASALTVRTDPNAETRRFAEGRRELLFSAFLRPSSVAVLRRVDVPLRLCVKESARWGRWNCGRMSWRSTTTSGMQPVRCVRLSLELMRSNLSHAAPNGAGRIKLGRIGYTHGAPDGAFPEPSLHHHEHRSKLLIRRAKRALHPRWCRSKSQGLPLKRARDCRDGVAGSACGRLDSGYCGVSKSQ